MGRRSLLARAAMLALGGALALGACAQVLGIETFQGAVPDPDCLPDGSANACGACCLGASVDTLPPLAVGGQPQILQGETRSGPSLFDIDKTASASLGFGCTTADGPEHVYAVPITSDGILTATLIRDATSFDSVLYARKDCCGAATMKLCADSTGCNGEALHGGEVLSFPVAKQDTIYLVVDGRTADDYGTYELQVRLDSGDSCGQKVPIHVEPGSPFVMIGDNHKLAGTPDPGNSAVNDCPGGGFVNGLGRSIIYDVSAPDVKSVEFHVLRTANVCPASESCAGNSFDSILYASDPSSMNPCGGSDSFKGVSFSVCKDNNAEKGCSSVSEETISVPGGSSFVFVDADTPEECCNATGGIYYLQVVPHTDGGCAAAAADPCVSPQDAGTD
jgi:hypothetical protein